MILYTLNEISLALWSCNSLIEVYKIQRALMLDASFYAQSELDKFQQYCDVRIQQIYRSIGKKE